MLLALVTLRRQQVSAGKTFRFKIGLCVRLTYIRNANPQVHSTARAEVQPDSRAVPCFRKALRSEACTALCFEVAPGVVRFIFPCASRFHEPIEFRYKIKRVVRATIFGADATAKIPAPHRAAADYVPVATSMRVFASVDPTSNPQSAPTPAPSLSSGNWKLATPIRVAADSSTSTPLLSFTR